MDSERIFNEEEDDTFPNYNKLPSHAKIVPQIQVSSLAGGANKTQEKKKEQ